MTIQNQGHEHEFEPQYGLPERLPSDERILWQGAPDAKALAVSAFHMRKLAIYFSLLTLVCAWPALESGAGPWAVLLAIKWIVPLAVVAMGSVWLLALMTAKTTVYTLTNKRVVLRFGVALPKCVNVPLSLVGKADVKPAGTGMVDVSLTPTVRFPLAYLQMWPHVRPWKFGSPQPMLRSVPENFVPQLADALAKADPDRVAANTDAAPAPAMVGAAA